MDYGSMWNMCVPILSQGMMDPTGMAAKLCITYDRPPLQICPVWTNYVPSVVVEAIGSVFDEKGGVPSPTMQFERRLTK